VNTGKSDGEQSSSRRCAILWIDLAECDRAAAMSAGLSEAIGAARIFASPERISLAVLEQDSPWWSAPLRSFPEVNVAIQSIDRGSAVSILLPFLRIFARDPGASIVFLEISRFNGGDLAPALALLDQIEAGEPRFTVFGGSGTRVCVASAATTLSVFHAAQPVLLQSFLDLRGSLLSDRNAVDEVYAGLPMIDFERDVLRKARDLVRTVSRQYLPQHVREDSLANGRSLAARLLPYA
jgi:hypothetical protein